jgi:haloalkane dehalogenase
VILHRGSLAVRPEPVCILPPALPIANKSATFSMRGYGILFTAQNSRRHGIQANTLERGSMRALKGLFCASVLTLISSAGVSAQSTAAPEAMKERTNLRNVRYCEIFVAKRHGMSATASVYNTVGLNDCPADKWNALNADKLKKELKAAAVIMNGPRYFIMDRNALLNPGGVSNFDGLEMRLVAQLELKERQKRTPYTENTVDRQNQYVYERGKNVYQLAAPDGRVYIMQSYSQEIDKTLNEEGLQTLASRLKLPKGWQYRIKKVDDDLVVRNAAGKAHVIQDDFRNSYPLIQ